MLPPIGDVLVMLGKQDGAFAAVRSLLAAGERLTELAQPFLAALGEVRSRLCVSVRRSIKAVTRTSMPTVSDRWPASTSH